MPNNTFSKAIKKSEPPIIKKAQTVKIFKRRVGDHGPPSQLWLITFADVMALMLTFFVLLFAMSNPKEENWEEITENLQKQFKTFYGMNLNQGSQDAVNIQKVDFNQALDLSYLKVLLEEQLKKNESLGNVTLIPQADTLIISLPDNLLFEAGKAELKPEGSKALFVVSELLGRMKNRIEVIGHADPRPVEKGSAFASNWELSLTRAAQVAGSLQNYGYAKDVTIRGQASGRFNDLPETMTIDQRLSLSRRVDIVIQNDDGEKVKRVEIQ